MSKRRSTAWTKFAILLIAIVALALLSGCEYSPQTTMQPQSETADNIQNIFGQLVQHWKAGHPNQFPKHLIYMRDGVAEGEFLQVLEREVGQIRLWFKTNVPNMAPPKMTAIVATKRHHIRFFPQ